MAIEKDGECLLCEGSPSVYVIFRPLIVALFALIVLFFVDASIFDEVWVLTSWRSHSDLLVVCLWISHKNSTSAFVRQEESF